MRIYCIECMKCVVHSLVVIQGIGSLPLVVLSVGMINTYIGIRRSGNVDSMCNIGWNVLFTSLFCWKWHKRLKVDCIEFLKCGLYSCLWLFMVLVVLLLVILNVGMTNVVMYLFDIEDWNGNTFIELGKGCNAFTCFDARYMYWKMEVVIWFYRFKQKHYPINFSNLGARGI